MAWGRTDINRQKTACSEKLTQSKITAPPQPVTAHRAGWGCSAMKCHQEAAAETFPCIFLLRLLPGSSPAAGNSFSRGSCSSHSSWSGSSTGRSPPPSARTRGVRARRDLAAFRPCSSQPPCHPRGSAATAGFPPRPYSSPFGVPGWAVPAGRRGRSTLPWYKKKNKNGELPSDKAGPFPQACRLGGGDAEQ